MKIKGKYQASNEKIPQEKRKSINEKILMLIDSGKTNLVKPDDIYNGYTGEGGLHGLKFDEFDSFHEYTEAKKEIENGQFLTPPSLAQFLIECLQPKTSDIVADLTMGTGVFFNYLPNQENAYGNELDIKAYKVAKFLYPQANLTHGDIRTYKPGDVSFDLIVGNPPFNLTWRTGGESYLSQHYYCVKAHELLKPGGLMALIVPSSFLADEFMDKGLISKMDALFNFIVQFDLPATSFKHVGVSHFETKMMFFQKKSEHITASSYTTTKETISLTEEGAEIIYSKYIKPLLEQKEAVRAKVFYENINNRKSNDFSYQVKKMLFDIKRNPKIKHHYDKSVEYVNKYYSQKKPDDITLSEWEQKKITKNKVLSRLKKILKEQHMTEKNFIKLVKTNYGLKIKGYSQKAKLKIASSDGLKKISFNDMLLQGRYPFADRSFVKLTKRKMQTYHNQNKDLSTIKPTTAINSFLTSFTLKDNQTNLVIKLNKMQKEDLGKVLTKPFSILNWEQGSGKTIGSIAWYKYMNQTKKVRNVFVVSSAIAINMTWEKKLEDYHEDFIRINKISDIERIKQGQIVLITLPILAKYQKQIKKYIRHQSYKIALVLDESDSLSNHRSKRTRATINVFRKVKYKLLATGTTTRNNINELYPQLELLYNNSINLLCTSESRYVYNKDNELEIKENEYFNKPFPAFYGQHIFKSCFCPSKTTVLGIKKDNQDIYNQGNLENIIRKTIITRRFKEIVGEDKYEIITHRIQQKPCEKTVYTKIMTEFRGLVWNYYQSTGNSRKDSMLMLIRQIQLLIKSVSIPHKFKEYTSTEIPAKFDYIVKQLKKFENEKVAIGTVFIETAHEYEKVIRAAFPGRQVFLIKGDVSFSKRSTIVNDFEATTNGILISTQQSLESSVNIPTCNKVIIEACQWNIPRISQYYFRFIRFDSKEFKEVHFITYDDSIEQNLMALLMAKQRLNEYIKTLDFKEQSNIYEEFGIDLDILNSLVEKAYDQDGKLYLTWGKQRVS